MTSALSAADLGIEFAINRKRRRTAKEILTGRGRSQGGSFWALRHITFDVAPGETVGVVGRNGSGKSTLLKLIAGVLYPDEGSVSVDGSVATLLSLSSGFSRDLTARDNIYLVGSLHGLDRDEIDQRFDDIVGFAEIERFIDTPMRHFSSGMRARLGFGIVNSLEDPIVLIDEVLAVGDQAFRRKCYATIDRFKEQGRTMFIVSHSERQVARLCERSMYLREGSLIDDGPTERVLARYKEEDAVS